MASKIPRMRITQKRALRFITGCIVVLLSLTPLSIHKNVLSPYLALEYRNNSHISNNKYSSSMSLMSHPNIRSTDRIYDARIGAFVIEEYKLIFVSIPKVACSEWKRMFMRMIGNPKWCKIKGINAHDPEVHKIPYLSQYPMEVATQMMLSPEWTKAVFVREPKERVLSAFLDKAVKEKWFFRNKCCEQLDNRDTVDECVNNSQSFASFLHYVTKFPKCTNVHWEAQAAKIDPKWWPYFNFIGYQNNLQEDSKRLLSRLHSNADGKTAWERVGSSGWGNDNDGCERRASAFLEENTSTHRLETGKKLLQWYDPKTEALVEKYWKNDWEQKEITFPEVKLYPS